MEDGSLFEYQYTMLDSPEPARLIINLDAPDTSGDVNVINNESSACKPPPSYDAIHQKPPMYDYASWYQQPNVDECSTATDLNFSESDDMSCHEKQESGDRSFDIDNILGLERHCYSPCHNTLAKDASTTFTHQGLEAGSQIQPNQSVNTETFSTHDINSLINTTNEHQINPEPSVNKRHQDKPPYTYVAMVIVAILNSDKKELTLAEIREKLVDMFPFFSGEYTGWKNSIRHALSNSKCFYKVERNDENDFSTVFVWKVNTDSVKSYTFNRQSKRSASENYKFTLQEELGLPPFDCGLGKGIKLPPKPCFVGGSASLAGSEADDFLNARNDPVPTPLSIVSDTDNTHISNIKPSLKRKRENSPSTQQTQQTFKRQTTSYNYPYYGYQQYSDSSRQYQPSYYSYYNPTPLAVGGQWSRGISHHNYQQQQQYGAHTMNSPAYSNQIQSARNMWMAYYNRMVPNSSQTTHNTNFSEWYTVTPVNLTKDGEHKDD